MLQYKKNRRKDICPPLVFHTHSNGKSASYAYAGSKIRHNAGSEERCHRHGMKQTLPNRDDLKITSPAAFWPIGLRSAPAACGLKSNGCPHASPHADLQFHRQEASGHAHAFPLQAADILLTVRDNSYLPKASQSLKRHLPLSFAPLRSLHLWHGILVPFHFYSCFHALHLL